MANLVFNYSTMNGGKTINVLQTAYSYEEKNIKFITIKAKKDTKGDEHILSKKIMKRKADILLDENDSLLTEKNYKLYYNVRLILVDEVQMLSESQIEELWTIAHLINIPIITYGLKSNFKGDIFSPTVSKLFALADSVNEIGNSCICTCGKPATLTGRKKDGKFTSVGEVLLIDGTEEDVEYIPLCGDCYFKHLKIGSEYSKKLSDLVEKIQ